MEHNPDLYDVSLVGKVDNLYIIIFTNDINQTPHFHIFDFYNPNYSSINIMIEINSPKYLNENTLTNIQINNLIKFLHSELRKNYTYWEFLIDTWNTNNSYAEIPYDLKMPDYTTLLS